MTFAQSLCTTYNSTACDETRYGENCEVPCSSQCKDQDGRDCDITSGVCLGGCKHIDNPANTDWWLGDRCDDVFIRKFTYNKHRANVTVMFYF